MSSRGGTVETEAKALDTVRLQSIQRLGREGGRGARGYGNLQTQCPGFVDHWKQIFATKWIAPGKYQVRQRVAKHSDLSQQTHTLHRGQL